MAYVRLRTTNNKGSKKWEAGVFALGMHGCATASLALANASRTEHLCYSKTRVSRDLGASMPAPARSAGEGQISRSLFNN